MTKKVDVYKVEYDIKNRPDENWVAYIAGFDVESVHVYLEGYVQGGGVHVNTISTVGRLDSVTDAVREFIAQPLLGEKVDLNAPAPVGEEKEVVVNESLPVKKKSIIPKG